MYSTITRPPFNPPDYVFGPIWSALFLLKGVSLYIAHEKWLTKNAKILFSAQLFLNILCSALFFGLELPMLAFICIIALWAMILMTIAGFYGISRTAGLLLVPYILW